MARSASSDTDTASLEATSEPRTGTRVRGPRLPTQATIGPFPARELVASPPFDATAGRSEGWLVVVEHGAAWPDCLAELLVATTVVLIAEQPGEPRSELIRRISAGVHKFPEHSWYRSGLVVRGADADVVPADVVEALQTAVGPRQPLLELRGGEPRLLVAVPSQADEPSRIRLQRPSWPECECLDERADANQLLERIPG